MRYSKEDVALALENIHSGNLVIGMHMDDLNKKIKSYEKLLKKIADIPEFTAENGKESAFNTAEFNSNLLKSVVKECKIMVSNKATSTSSEAHPINMKAIRIFSEVPTDAKFTEDCIYRLTHGSSESFINGIQAEALIGLNHNIRLNLINNYCDNFRKNGYYVSFFSYLKNSNY